MTSSQLTEGSKLEISNFKVSESELARGAAQSLQGLHCCYHIRRLQHVIDRNRQALRLAQCNRDLFFGESRLLHVKSTALMALNSPENTTFRNYGFAEGDQVVIVILRSF